MLVKKLLRYFLFRNLMADIKYMHKIRKVQNKYCKSSVMHKLFEIYTFYLHQRILRLYSCDIHRDCHLGKINFRHPIGIVIGGGVEIADNVTILQGVTFGSLRFDPQTHYGLACHQVVGENTIIGAGAKILGDVIIGKECVIGANAVVTKNVPDNSVVVGFNKILPRSFK